MDDFTKRLMERNEMRNKALGIPVNKSNTSVQDMSAKVNNKENKRDSISKKNVLSPRKSTASLSSSLQQPNNNELVRTSKTPVKTITSKKEDADVAVEINITSTQNIQVEVEVAECEYDENGKMIKKGETLNSLSNFNSSSFASSSNIDTSSKIPQLSDHSRKNLKRLGVLYSETDQISSPIQRTEENFCEQSISSKSSSRPIKKFSKLAELAQDINSWDDDYSHHQNKSQAETSGASTSKTGSPMKFGSPMKTASPFKFGSPSKNQSSLSTPERTRSGLFSSPTRKDSLKSAPATDKSSSTASTSSPKKLLWDKKVVESLEAQGFTRRESTVPKLVYDYAKPSSVASSSPSKKSITPQSSSSTASIFAKPQEVKKPMSPAKKFEPVKAAATVIKAPSSTSSVASTSNAHAIPKMKIRQSNMFAKNQKDPVEMSLKERMAIFEKNKGSAPMPRTPYGISDANPIRSNMPELTKKYDFGFKSPRKATTSTSSSDQQQQEQQPKETVSEKATVNIKTAVSKLLSERETTISEKQISDEIRKQREEDMKCILNRFTKPIEDMKETDGDEIMMEEKSERKRRSNSGERPSTGKQQKVPEQSEDLKKRARISTNPPRLYPVLSDIESTTDSEIDNYTTATVSCSEDNGELQLPTIDSDTCDDEEDNLNMSIGREILNTVRKSNDLSNHSYLESTVTSTDVSDAMNDMDDYLNQALDDDDDDSKDYDDKGSAYSDSFEYERYPKRVSFKEPGKTCEIPIKSKLEISPAKSPKGSMTLVHTVSFYRRQQSASANNTPIKKIIHKPDDNVSAEQEQMQMGRKAREECDKKIQRLLDEVMRQQTVISQTSQALNLCASTVEFSGSTEAVEGERHLLVATHRRLACLNEVQRLKVEGLVDRCGASSEKGTLSIQEIIIPLKQTYINRLATDEINGHHLLCLVKYNEYVLATRTLPTLPGLKSVKFTDALTFNEVYADFKITLEIYGMTAQREILPHDIKYHIQTPNKKKFKSRLQESNLVRPPIQSPGGPNAVRTPALVQYGYIIFSLREIKQKSWVINETAPGVSPLNGNVYLKIDSKITVDVNHGGFLTMFDDISGFGAWHRRWCRLTGNKVYYWKYPEDEKKKSPLGELDLKSIVSEKADQAPRSICARLHTILMESKRDRRSDDTETLVTVPKDKYTIVRHLLAADTKEDREEWCEHLNKCLSLLKSWGNHH